MTGEQKFGKFVDENPLTAEQNGCQWAMKELIRRHYAAQQAIDIAVRYGGIDGAHHKQWVIDQMVRLLAGKQYAAIVKEACDGEDGPETYDWDCGIAP